MRPLEIALAAALLLQIFFAAAGWRRAALPGPTLAALTLLIGGIQWGWEGFRWQLLPFYALAALLGLREWRRWRAHTPPATDMWGKRAWWAVVLWGGGVALAVLLPVPQWPGPTGPYAVGTASWALTDSNRREIYSPDPEQPRRLMVQVWYPAAPTGKEPLAPWLAPVDEQIRAVAQSGGLPPWMLTQLRYVHTHARQNAPLASDQDRYPVIHFSHGYGGFRSQATFLTEELASRGYIVISTEHPYAALNTVFPDGTRIPFDPNTLPEDVPDEVYDAAARRLLNQWVEDTSFVQETFMNLPPDSPLSFLAGRMDWSRMVAMGHSTGGAAALQFCIQEALCRAVVTLDPWMKPLDPDIYTQPYPRPILALFSDPAMAYFKPENHEAFVRLVQNASARVCDLTIYGTGHHDFDDTGAFSPLAPLFGHSKGPLAVRRSFSIIRQISQRFLAAQLNGVDISPVPTDETDQVAGVCVDGGG